MKFRTSRSLATSINRVINKKPPYTTDDINILMINELMKVHSREPYEYGLVDYDNKKKYKDKNIEIICRRHGVFKMTAQNHLEGGKCPKCDTKPTNSKHRMVTWEHFDKMVSMMHGKDTYGYTPFDHIDDITEITIICKNHGPFVASVRDHIAGRGCPSCGITRQTQSIQYGKFLEHARRDSELAQRKDEFLAKSKEVHGGRYDYSNVVYKMAKEKVEILCPVHGPFYKAPTVHLLGSGCPQCRAINQNILYLLRCNTTGLYKVGVTTHNVQRRIAALGGDLIEVFSVVCEYPKKYEAYIHALYHGQNVFNPDVNSGGTEFFDLTDTQVKEVENFMIEASNITQEKSKAIATLLSLTKEQVHQVVGYMEGLKSH